MSETEGESLFECECVRELGCVYSNVQVYVSQRETIKDSHVLWLYWKKDHK